MPRFFALIAAYGLVAALHASPAEARRVALVIGNADYRVGPLQNPVNDAVAVAETFQERLGFDKVILRKNLGFDGFRAALIEMSRASAGAELGVVYFAGHGTEVGGRNFLIPVDARLGKASALDLEAVPLDTVLSQLNGVRKLKLVILDACRNNPFAVAGAKRTVRRGLARIEPEDNTLVVYAAKDGTTADDGVGYVHSPFTEALLKHIATPGLEIGLVFRRVRDDVVKATGHQLQPQQPHVYASLGGQELYLLPKGAAPAAPIAAAAPSDRPPSGEAERAWAIVKDSADVRDLEAFRRRYGSANPFYDRQAERRIETLRRQTVVAPPALPVPAEGVEPPAAAARPGGAAVLAELAGTWRGVYSYARRGRGPVEFTMSLEVYGDVCRGRTEEPNTFGHPSAPRLYANVECQVVDGTGSPRLRFIKTYDGTGGKSHSVDYLGDISADRGTLTGTWRIGTVSGGFSLTRQ
jgi:hypothetical protein